MSVYTSMEKTLMFFKRYKSLVANLALIFMLSGGMFGARAVESVQATSLIVENVNDSGPGSLRQAMIDAISGDTITFNSSLAGQMIVLASALPTIDKTLIIDGGAQSIAIDGAHSYRIFKVTTTGNLTVNHLTLQNGNTSSPCLNDVPSAPSCGGAIYSDGLLTVLNSTFLGNSAENGGGIAANRGTASITNSTFLNNVATRVGGGIVNWLGTVSVSNSTFFGNSATYHGGGIYNDYGSITLTNNTFSGNSATHGGGLYNAGMPLHFMNNILADSVSGEDCYNEDGAGEIATNINNLVETNGTAPNNCGVPALSGDPALDPLGDNGGFTQTMALQIDSPAINAGDDATCLATDQRGVTRPQGSHCDIGAYEFDGWGENNLVLNPGFETQGSSTTDAANWTEGANHARASDKFHTGGWALHSTYRGMGTDTHTTAPIPVSQNTTYIYSGYIWRTNTIGAACMDMGDITGERQLCTGLVDSWQYLTGTWNSGSNTSVSLRLITDGLPTGDIWFDDISLTKSDETPTNTPTATQMPTLTPTPIASPIGNLVLNPGFEVQESSVSDAANWTEGTNHTRASDKFHSGGWALHSTFRGAGTNTRTTAPIAVKPNTDYTYSGYIWRANSIGGACMDMNDIAGERQLCTDISGSWQYLAGTWNSGSNTNVTLRLITDGSPTGDILFDDISLSSPVITPPAATQTSTPIPSSNLVLNPGFEVQGSSAADAANWTEGTNHARASDKFHAGGWALHSAFHGVGMDTHTTVPIAVVPNTTYTYSGYIWRANSIGAACMDMDDIASETQLCASKTGSWQFLAGTWHSGSNTSVTLRLITDGSPTGDIWFDDISLK